MFAIQKRIAQIFAMFLQLVSRRLFKKKRKKNPGISLIREIQTSINIRLTIPL